MRGRGAIGTGKERPSEKLKVPWGWRKIAEEVDERELKDLPIPEAGQDIRPPLGPYRLGEAVP